MLQVPENPTWPPIWPPKSKFSYILEQNGSMPMILVSKYMFFNLENPDEALLGLNVYFFAEILYLYMIKVTVEEVRRDLSLRISRRLVNIFCILFILATLAN